MPEFIIYKEAETFDAREILPPLPLLFIKKKIRNLEKGEVLKVILNILNYPEVKSELAAWAKALGHRILEAERRGHEIIFFIEKDGSNLKKMAF